MTRNTLTAAAARAFALLTDGWTMHGPEDYTQSDSTRWLYRGSDSRRTSASVADQLARAGLIDSHHYNLIDPDMTDANAAAAVRALLATGRLGKTVHARAVGAQAGCTSLQALAALQAHASQQGETWWFTA